MHSRLIRVWAARAKENSGSYTCELKDADLSNVLAISLKSCSFLNSVENVQEDVNDSLGFQVGGANSFVTLPAGQYTLAEALAALTALMNANAAFIAAGATVAFTVTLGKVQATVTGNTMRWLGSNFTYDGSADLAPFLGITESSAVLPDGTLYRAPNLPDFSGLSHATVSVKSKDPFTRLNDNALKVRRTNALSTIPVNVPFGPQQTFIEPDLIGSRLDFRGPEDLTTFKFTVRDPMGKPLPGQKNSFYAEVVIWFN